MPKTNPLARYEIGQLEQTIKYLGIGFEHLKKVKKTDKIQNKLVNIGVLINKLKTELEANLPAK